MNMEILKDRYLYSWPAFEFSASPEWSLLKKDNLWHRRLPESKEDLREDSRWPALFPSPICLVTTADGSRTALEKVVAPVIVNRFPYVIALSFCREDLSGRHYARKNFMEILERGGGAAVQFLAPGESLDKVMDTIASIEDHKISERMAAAGLPVRPALSNDAPVFEQAYLVYEAKLVKPMNDYEGNPIFSTPYVDVGSHRIYFLEIHAIQMREDIARGESQIVWQSLPVWESQHEVSAQERKPSPEIRQGRYKKGYNPHYRFPGRNTIAFAFDEVVHGMAVKGMSSQVVNGNDDSRWPCFFPSSCGMVTSFLEDGTPNVMPCGSTAVVGRSPFTIGICVAYADINERYRPRSSLQIIRKAGKFGCGVPFISDKIINAITYAGNCSIDEDKKKLYHSGLAAAESFDVPILTDLPISFECRVSGEIKLGTHVMFLGEVERIYVRCDATAENPVRWYPWAHVETA